MVSQGASPVPTSLPLCHAVSPGQSRAAVPFPSPPLFIRAWVSPLSFPLLQEDRDGGSCLLLLATPYLRGNHEAQLELRQYWDKLFQQEKTRQRGHALVLRDISRSQR